MSIAAILIIIAVILAFLHAVLWQFVATYRNPAMLHAGVIIGFVGTLLLALGVGS